MNIFNKLIIEYKFNKLKNKLYDKELFVSKLKQQSDYVRDYLGRVQLNIKIKDKELNRLEIDINKTETNYFKELIVLDTNKTLEDKNNYKNIYNNLLINYNKLNAEIRRLENETYMERNIIEIEYNRFNNLYKKLNKDYKININISETYKDFIIE